MKWLLEMDEDILTGFLIGCFVVTFFFAMFFIGSWSIYPPFIFLVVWIYALIKRGKIKKENPNNNSV